MKRDIERLKRDRFDLIIIGAGITGACLAYDATLRGLSVAIIDKNDFGAETSAASSKLLHGGIRYLQQGRILKVLESAKERVYFQTIAPHLTQYLPFIVPTYKRLSQSKFFLMAGMIVYSIICFGQNRSIRDKEKHVPKWKLLNKQDIKKFIPIINIKDITGGVMFYESHMHSSERMTLGILETAYSHGAAIANYIKCDSYDIQNNKVIGINATDVITGDKLVIRGVMVINAAGPWIPLLNKYNRKSNDVNKDIVTAYFKGVHIVTNPLTNQCAIALVTKKQNQVLINRGGRHIFIIPWRGYSLIGTTYDAYDGKLDEVCPTKNDVEGLIEDINLAFGKAVLKYSDVKYTYAGIYPLIEDDVNPNVYQGTGDYQVIDHSKYGLEGLITVFGAKYTTARLLAERTLNKIAGKFDKPLRKCKTRTFQIDNGKIESMHVLKNDCYNRYDKYLSKEIIDNLITNYGIAIDKVMNIAIDDPSLLERIAENRLVIKAEAVYAARNEILVTLDDFVFRRTGLGTLGSPGEQAIKNCAELLANELGWDNDRMLEETERVVKKFKIC